MSTLKRGDEVRVFETYQGEMRSPADGWPGTVIKVGRKLVTISRPGMMDAVFRIDTGRLNGTGTHDTGVLIYFLTPGEIQARIEAAIGKLAAAGIESHRTGATSLAVSLDDAEKLASLLAAEEGNPR